MKNNSPTGEDGVLHVITLVLALALLIIVGALVVWHAGGEDDGPSVQTVTTTVPPFANLWNKTVATIDVQTSSAELIDLRIRTDFNRTPTFAWLNFIGKDGNGTSRSYDIQWNPPDRLVIIVSSKPVETPFSGTGCNPMYVLEQIDQVDLAKVLPGDGRLEVFVENGWGPSQYEDRFTDLYCLENGSFTPLKHVAYSTDEPVYTVMIDRSESSDSESSESIVYPRPKEERSQLIAFLSPDLAKADEIVPRTTAYEEHDIPLTGDTDLAAFARDEMNRSKIFQEELAGTVPGDAVFVHSLDEKRYDYWLIPYEKDRYIALIAQVSIKGDVADFSSAYVPSVKTQDVVRPTMDEARKVLSENGYDGSLSARLVWKPCEQTQSLAHPVWEFKQADGDLIYVGYDPFDDTIQVYDELTEKTIMG